MGPRARGTQVRRRCLHRRDPSRAVGALARASRDKWSPAEEALHVALAYEFGIDAVTSGAAMRVAVPPMAAWVARRLLLPLLRLTRTFPRGASAPAEVRPSPAAAATLSASEVIALLTRQATEAAAALHDADARRPAPRVTHANFGALTPLEALHLLTLHTRHHARSITRSRHGVGESPQA